MLYELKKDISKDQYQYLSQILGNLYFPTPGNYLLSCAKFFFSPYPMEAPR